MKRGDTPIGANLFFASLENNLDLGSAFAWRVGKRTGNLMPAAEHVRQRKRWFDGALDLVEGELEITPSTAAAWSASRSPRGKRRWRGAASFR